MFGFCCDIRVGRVRRVDLVDDEWLELVCMEVIDYVVGIFFDGVLIVFVVVLGMLSMFVYVIDKMLLVKLVLLLNWGIVNGILFDGIC